MVFVIVLVAFILVASFDYLPLKKKLSPGERIAYLALLSLSFVLLLLASIDVHLPSLTGGIISLLQFLPLP